MEQTKQVVISVSRGVADVVYVTPDVDVEIIDLDNEPERKDEVEGWLTRCGTYRCYRTRAAAP